MRYVKLTVGIPCPEPLAPEDVHRDAIDALIATVGVADDYGIEVEER